MCDGETVQEVPLGTDGRSAAFTVGRRVTESGWCHLRAEGAPAERFPMDVSYVQAFTNPVWLVAGDEPVPGRGPRPTTPCAGSTGCRRWRTSGPAGGPSGNAPTSSPQFDEAREVYRGFARESTGAAAPRP